MPNESAIVPKAIGLSDMSPGELGAAGTALRHAGDLHESSGTICRILEGLVLLEGKAKLPHGKFIPWVEKHWDNAHRIATRRMHVSKDFLAALSSGKLKLDPQVQFDPVRLLLSDLASNLTELEQAKLDMSNPIVQAADAYASGRSYSQILLDLGPAGYDRSSRGKGKTGVTAKTPREQAEEILLPLAEEFTRRWIGDGLWVHLPRRILREIDGELLEIRQQIKKALAS